MRVIAALAALALSAAAAEPQQRDLDRRRGEIAKELVRLAAEIERAIVAGDAGALLGRVPPEGLRCAGRVVPRARVERDLRSSGSWLHDVFFGGPAYRPPPGTPESLAAFLRAAREVAVLVTFEADERAGPIGRPCVDFRAKGVGTPGAPLCFEQRGGTWWFTESLYPCG